MDVLRMTDDTSKMADTKKTKRGIILLLVWLATFFVPYYITIAYQCYQHFLK